MGKTKKGKGTKWMMVVDGNGIPLAAHICSAQPAEVKLALTVIDKIHVGTATKPQTRAKKLVADRGYDAKWLREELRKRSMQPKIPYKRRRDQVHARKMTIQLKEDYGKRWKVERTFAWLGNYRRLLVRWEHHLSIYTAFFTFACILICLGRF
ncbi:MAG: IS5/IS1182 family transposase [Candidatus Lloydbacteria bacterium CG22_combo_CG10-13_8_21_14_all_47_15]|uniref:IS5/IS1182 family transposase n=1 Tax=Candidatus Lloydbacteria bacterium CG22_combo_CG10-13_8_21_14_all_47_15 TaxID=1974635 RepID=A0A2H0CUZ9_9BACT|nr:MAG: IS5/IS1182 family transposase [Candidatus Lloydbacteria bacterium CG22_combo_CG10-13_8_21_14_all_47_15]